MICPTCTNTHLLLAERHGIEIDYCPQCRGIWLDRGEIDKMVEHFAKMQTPSGNAAPTREGVQPREHSEPRYDRDRLETRDRDDDRDDDWKRDGKRRGRREGFLEGLMDIFD